VADTTEEAFFDDLEADAEALKSLEGKDGQLLSLTKLANQLKLVRGEMARLETEMAQQKKIQDQLEQFDIPGILTVLGLKKLTLTTGETLQAKEDFRPSIPKETESKTFEWLREKGHGSIIKFEIKVATGMGEEAIAQKALEVLKEAGIPAASKEHIHFQTLAALVREMVANGEVIDPAMIKPNPFWKITLK